MGAGQYTLQKEPVTTRIYRVLIDLFFFNFQVKFSRSAQYVGENKRFRIASSIFISSKFPKNVNMPLPEVTSRLRDLKSCNYYITTVRRLAVSLR